MKILVALISVGILAFAAPTKADDFMTSMAIRQAGYDIAAAIRQTDANCSSELGGTWPFHDADKATIKAGHAQAPIRTDAEIDAIIIERRKGGLPEIPPAKVRKWRSEEAKRRQGRAKHGETEIEKYERKLDELAQQGRAAAEAQREAERQRVIDLGNEEIARARRPRGAN
jgi:hypothetical protein